jgi:hypothetical protein
MRSIGAKIAAVCTWVDDVGNFVRWFGGGHCGRGFLDGRRRASRGLVIIFIFCCQGRDSNRPMRNVVALDRFF